MTLQRIALTLAAVVLLAASDFTAVLSAQGGTPAPVTRRSELGMKVGIGRYGYDESLGGRRSNVSVEACLRCGTRALFVEYSRWNEPQERFSWLNEAHTVTAGLRLQGQGRTRPYFDAGVAIGGHRLGERATTTVGGTIGTGVTILPAERFYIRLGARLMIMSNYYIGADAAVGAGWRF